MSDLIERIESLERFMGSPGWQEMGDDLFRRRGSLMDRLVHEKPGADREVLAAQVRELDLVLAWPAKTIQSLTDKRERDEQGGHDGEG